MDPLGFAVNVAESAFGGYFQKTVVTTAYPTNSLEAYLTQMQDFVAQHLIHEVVQHRGLKVFPILHCIYEKPMGEELILTPVPLAVKSFVITHQTEIAGQMEVFAKEIKVRNENILRLQSFLNMAEVSHLELNLAEYNPLHVGSTYTPLPQFLEQKHSIINVQNTDERCFGYSVLAAISNVDSNNNPSHTRHYNHKFGWRGLDQLQYPVDIADIPAIEKKLEVGFNVYSFYDDEGRARYPLHICKEDYPQHFDLLYWNGHYAWIRDFSRFMGDISTHHGKKFFCRRCLGHFTEEIKLCEHMKYCSGKEGMQQVIQLPVDPQPLKFKKYCRQQRLPFVIYADFECLVPPTGKVPVTEHAAFEYQNHLPYSVGLKMVSTVPELSKLPYKEHHGEDCTQWLLEELARMETLCVQWLFKEERMIFNAADRRKFDSTTACYLCTKPFGDAPMLKKVRDHDHLTGKFRGAAHSHCNIRMRKTYQVPVFFHNFRGYDSHLVVQSLSKFPLRKISVIGQAMEKYLSLSWGEYLVFKDSFQFLSCSLEQLVANLLKSGKDHFVQLNKEFAAKPELLTMLFRKGIYPYDYMDSPARFNEGQLPPKDAFFSRLRDSGVSDEDYQHAQKVWTVAGCTRFAEYHALYLKSMHSLTFLISMHFSHCYLHMLSYILTSFILHITSLIFSSRCATVGRCVRGLSQCVAGQL